MSVSKHKQEAREMLEALEDGRASTFDAIHFIDNIVQDRNNQPVSHYRNHPKYCLTFQKTGPEENFHKRVVHILTSWSS